MFLSQNVIAVMHMRLKKVLIYYADHCCEFHGYVAESGILVPMRNPGNVLFQITYGSSMLCWMIARLTGHQRFECDVINSLLNVFL